MYKDVLLLILSRSKPVFRKETSTDHTQYAPKRDIDKPSRETKYCDAHEETHENNRDEVERRCNVGFRRKTRS